MTNPISHSAVEIEKTADALKRLRPAYKDLLDFYKEIFVAQENAQQQIHIEPIHIPEHILSIKLKEGFPLVSRSELVIDEAVSEDLLTMLCRIALQANEKLAASAESLRKAMDNGQLDTAALFKSFMDDETGFLENAAEALKIEHQVLMFFIYSSIKPSLVINAQKLSKLLPSKDERLNGRCPVCGNMPEIATLEGEGGRFLHCSFCCYKWRIQRLFCAFCSNEDHQTLGYFYSEAEPEYRVDTCDRCKSYMKTVDMRKVDRLLYPPLERVCSLHLDIKAEEAGFKSPISQAGKI
jgi:FdhE protein